MMITEHCIYFLQDENCLDTTIANDC